MSYDTAGLAPPPLAGESVPFQGCDAMAQLPDLAAEVLDFLAQCGHGFERVGGLRDAAGVRGQEGALALVAHGESVRRQLPDGGSGDGHGDVIGLLQLSQGGELSGLLELASCDPSPQVISHLLVGESVAGPLDHLHPKSHRGLCLIVPKSQR